MNWRINLLLVVLALFSCKKENAQSVVAITNPYLIEVEDLKSIIIDENIKILDFRKKEKYDKEHIIGAQHIWRTDIVDATYPYNGMMASKAQIETLFGQFGITNNDTIIVYDDNALCEAARLWWILQNYNFKNIKMLQGGISEWKSKNGSVTSQIPNVIKSEFKLSENFIRHNYASKEQVNEALNNNSVILDTRSFDEFSGKNLKKGATKAGRITNSIHIDWAEAVNYNGDKRLKPIIDLEFIFNKLNIKKEDPIIIYCHSGVRSAHTTFVLTQLLGYKNVKNYDGSWTEWSYFNDLPFQKDSITLNNN